MIKKSGLTVTAYMVLISGMFLTSCSSFTNRPVEKQSFNMGTIITQKVYGKNAQKAVDEVIARIQEIERKMTINAEGSEIDAINSMAGKEEVNLGEDTVYVLECAKKYAELSEGAFDVTVGPLVKAWGIFTDHPRVPPQDEINGLLPLVNYRELSTDSKKSSAKLSRQGQIVDLGGIAKGYTGDEVIKIYRKYGIKSGYINLGGNVVVIGSKPDGKPWSIGVQNPRAENGKYIGILKVIDKSIVSSGDYERFFEKNGKRYHHILDPETGYPSESGLISTTIVSDASIDGDALSTATFVLGLDKGMKLVENLNGVEAVFITSDKKVYTTPGLKNVFTMEDESKEYKYVEKR